MVAPSGTLLAFCEGREEGPHDWQALYVVLKRSTDNGVTWESMQVLAGDGERTHHNPTAVVDRETGTVWLAFGIDAHQVYVMNSTDNGVSWSEPKDITKDVKLASWTYMVTGPGHGIQLKNGRLLIPGDHSEGFRRDTAYQAFSRDLQRRPWCELGNRRVASGAHE